MTLPLLPSTFPTRTTPNLVPFACPPLAIAWTINSPTLLVAPITLVGFTALSVEIIRKRDTPCRTAARASTHVPPTLFFTASHGLDSMRGTCLWAAAWKRRPGRWAASTASTRRRSVMSPTTAWISHALPRSRKSLSMAKRLFSYRSKSTRLRGPNERICRHNSDPMDPPAPVTRTVCPAIRCLIGPGSRPTGALGSRSEIASSRISLTDTLPSITSRRLGTG